MTNNDSTRYTGKIKWYDETKGYGFIAMDNNEKDIFLHGSAVQSSDINYLQEGDQVSFEIETDSKTNKTSASKLESVD